MVTFYRRHLPHWNPPKQDLFITWRLKGSLPSHLQGIPPKETPGRRFLELDRALDRADAGPLWLRDPDIAGAIIAVLRTLRDQRIATVHAYAVLANHVHILLTPTAHIARVTRLVKGVTARKANLLLNLTGQPFWQDESFDHWVRTPTEWRKIHTYIERNPVTAGLVQNPQDWPFSSASNPINK
jgi:putative transposase